MRKAFTLAEVLITLAIIGVVAAISIPSVISNSQQQEFKTGLRKAVSVLNSAITMNMAIDGESPYDNANLMGYLMRHMGILKTIRYIQSEFAIDHAGGAGASYNSAFWTTDGMRFEFRENASGSVNIRHKLYESNVYLCSKATNTEAWGSDLTQTCGGCGSYGLNSNVDKTTKPPCLIMVDVNGDRKPNPANVNCKSTTHIKDVPDCAKPYKYSDPLGLKLTDLFTIIITDKQAIPYGVAAQRAMYQAQK